MSVSSVVNRVSFAGNGSSTVFAFPYPFHRTADLRVILVDALGLEFPQTLGTQFSVSGAVVDAIYPNGGSVTMAVAPATGEKLVIFREPSLTQDLELGENDPFPANEIEKRLDKLTLIAQRAADRAARSVALSDAFTGTFDGTLPKAPEANRMLMINSTSTGFALGPTPQELSDAAAAVSGSIEAADDAAASALAAANSAAAANTSAAGANQSRTTAERWANFTGGTVIDAATGADTGEYSAKKYATDAIAEATSSAGSATAAALSAAAAAQSAIDAASAAGGGITSLTGHVVGAGPGAANTVIQPGVVTSAMLAPALQTAIDAKSAQLNDAGFGVSLVASASTAKVKKVVAGANITVTDGADGITVASTASGGVADHGDLTGLADDDHTQYHNDVRGDARYFTQAQVTTALAAKSATLNDTGVGESLIGAAATGKLKKIVAGANITLTQGTDGLTIASSGGGGGGPADLTTATGILALSKGGTGVNAASAAAAFDALSPNTTKGDITVRGTGANGRLGVGATGQFLAADVNEALGVKWATASVGATRSVLIRSAAYTAAIGDGVSVNNASSAAYTITLPSASGQSGETLTFMKATTDTTFNAISLGAVTTLNTSGENVTLLSDGTNWIVFKRRIPSVTTSFTPSGGTWIQNTTYSGRWTRLFESAEIQIGVSLTGAPNNVGLLLPVPSGLNIDLAKQPLTIRQQVGGGQAAAGFAYVFHINTIASNTSQVEVVFQDAVNGRLGAPNATVPVSWVNGHALHFKFKVPIVGWNG